MADWIEAARLDELPPGRGTRVVVAGRAVALFNVDGTVYAIDDACRHRQQSLGTSRLAGTIVTCQGHGMRYDVTTGCVASQTSGGSLLPAGWGVASYPVEVVDGKILVAVPAPPAGTDAPGLRPER
jgi:3-phenylpropionate/trans-cinnamate dioxygenase ferredoxin component